MLDPTLSLHTQCKLFLSYSRRDIQAARALHQHLEAQGIKTWIDLEGINPTQIWLDELTKAILTKHIFVFLKSAHSESSEMCLTELEKAQEFGMRIVVVDLDFSTPGIFADGSIQRLPYNLGLNELASHIQRIISQEGNQLIKIQNLVEKAFNWNERNHADDLLLKGETLSQAYQFYEGLREKRDFQNRGVKNFLEISKRVQDDTFKREKMRSNTRSFFYAGISILVIFLTILSFNYKRISSTTRDKALQNKYEAQEMLEYITGDLSNTFQRGGNFSLLSDAINQISGFFDNTNPATFDKSDHIFNSRIGHFLGEIKILQKEFEEARQILQRSLSLDNEALLKHPGDADIIWTRSFTIFWIGEMKHHHLGYEAAREDWAEFHRIMLANRHRSSEWEYEYLNSVYNLLILASYGNEINDTTELEQEIQNYYAELKTRTIDHETLLIDLFSTISRLEIIKAKYQEVANRANTYNWDQDSDDFFYNTSLQGLNEQLAYAHLYLGDYSAAEKIFTETIRYYLDVIEDNPAITFFDPRIENILLRKIVLHRLANDPEKLEEIYQQKSAYLIDEIRKRTPQTVLNGIESLIHFERDITQKKFSAQTINDMHSSTRELIDSAEMQTDSKRRIAEGLFQAIIVSLKNQRDDLALQSLSLLKELIDLKHLDPRESRLITAYYRSLQLLNLNATEQERIGAFLSKYDCYDSFIDTLERWFHEQK